MKISLTFDNGPDLDVTPRVLDTLAEYDVKATFFVLGKNLAVPAVRRIAERAFSEGHRLGNHSYNHSVPFGLLERPSDGIEEILSTDALLGELRGSERLYRPFGRAKIGPHLLNKPTWEMLVAKKFSCVLWTCVAPERVMPDSWMLPVCQACEGEAWSVVVLHDIPAGGTRHLGQFLRILTERGAEFSQDFPVECTPLRNGIQLGSADHLMPAPEAMPLS